jgi:hypothetical protein
MHRTLTALLVASLVCLAGCGEEANIPEGMAPVTGTVTLDGKPLAGATVSFIPDGVTKGAGSYGVTSADGKYELQGTQGGTGAAAGYYRVIISKLVMPDGSPIPADIPSATDAGAKDLLPAIYSSYDVSTLTAEVPAQGGAINFDLKSKR